MREAVIIHQGALGDFIQSLPICSGLAALYPGISLHFVCRPAHAELVASQPYFAGAISCDGSRLGPFYLESGWEKVPLPPAFIRSEALFWIGQPASRIVAERLQARLGKRVHWLQSFPVPPRGRPVGDFLLEQMRRLGYPLPDALPSLEVPSRPANRDGVLIHPGSGGRAKIWPLGCWHALIQWLLTNQIPVRIVLGPADAPLSAFARAMAAAGCALELNLSLPRLTALMAASRLVVGNDSGVTHLAAALGLDTVAVFGPASPAMWRPRGPRVRVVNAAWLADQGLAWPELAVPEAIAPVARAVCDLLADSDRVPAFSLRRRTESAADDGAGGFPVPARPG